jgi:S1-C subfamily serine protease
MTAFRGRVERGNSGGPVVDRRGRVLTTVFAAAVSESAPRGFGVPNSIVGKALRRAGAPVDTGPCTA